MSSFNLNDLADQEHEGWAVFERYAMAQLSRMPTEAAALRLTMIPVIAYYRLYDRTEADGGTEDEAHIAGCLAASIITELATTGAKVVP